MPTHMSCPRLLMTLLDERYYEEAPTRPVVCRLWRMRSAFPAEGRVCYALGMESLSRRYLYYVGENEAAVRGLFARVAEGRLSPIHFRAVVEDFLWELEHGSPSCGERTTAQSLP